MAADISDELRLHDIQIQNTDKYRTYNLLEKKFEDNAAIGLDIANMIRIGLHIGQIEGIFLQYLSKFNIILSHFSIKKDSSGSVNFLCKFFQPYDIA